jgi:spermidine synthase
LLLAAVSAFAWFALDRSRGGASTLGVVALCAIAGISVFLPSARVPDLGAGMRLLEARESTYQSVRVVDSREDSGVTMRKLQVNESFDSFQSVWQEKKGLLPAGYYYNAFAMPLWWSRDVRAWRIAVIGLGGGTAWRVLDGARPPDTTLDLVGAEIDPVVVELAQRWMDLPVGDPRCRVLSGRDGRAALRLLSHEQDLLVLDAYANQMEIPPHLASVEFFAECRAALHQGGWLVANVGGFGFADPVVDAVARTLAVGFEQRVLAVRVPFSRNVALFVRRGAEPPEPASSSWKTGNVDLDRIMAGGSLPDTWRWFAPANDPVLTDDLNPIEALQRRSIEMAAASTEDGPR